MITLYRPAKIVGATGRTNCRLSPGPGGRAVRRGVAAQRGGVAHLGRRAALGRRQRPHHRGSLQDRRRGPGRRGGHHPRRHAGPGRPPAGGCWWRGEGVRAVGVPDRPAGEGDCQGRWPFRLGVLQRPQRARRHGPAHGPERRPHPRDRTPGPLEAGRRQVGRYTRGETAGSALRYL